MGLGGAETTGARSLEEGWILQMVVLEVEVVRPEAGRGEGMGGEKRRLVAGLTLMSPTGPGPLLLYTLGSMLSRSSVVVESCRQNLLRSKSLLLSTALVWSVLMLVLAALIVLIIRV